MRRTHVLTALALLFGAAWLSAGTLTTLPIAPKAGESIQLEYTPAETDKAMMERGSLHAVVYTFTMAAESPLAVEVPLEKSGKRWSNAVTLPKDVVYAIVKVGNGAQYDNNKELFWEILVHNDKSMPVEGAAMKAAIARYGQLQAPCRMKDAFDDALEYLNKETRNNPKNIAGQVNYILVAKSLGDISEEEAKLKFRDVTAAVSQINTPLEAVAVAQAYANQEKTEEAQRVMTDAIKRFPTSNAAEQGQLETLNTAKSLIEFVSLVSDHIKKWPSSGARQAVIDAVLNAATKEGALDVLANFIATSPGLPARTYHQAVNYLGTVDSLRPLALKFVDAGITAAKDEQRKPQYMGISEWKEEQRLASSQLRYVQGAILNAQGKQADAITALEQSVEIGGDEMEKGAAEMLVTLQRNAGNTKRAIAVAERAISLGVSTQGIVDAYRSMLAAKGKDSADIAEQEQELRAEGRKRMSAKVVQNLLNQQAIEGTFTTLDGKKINISDWKGKVVFIDYWATWCGPCRQSFPALQKLYMRYKDNPNVVFAVVNVWERSDDRTKTVREFLDKNKTLTFPMLLDLNDSVVSKFGVTGIPSKFILGKDGRVQFKEVGLMPEEQFLEESTQKIEALLGM